MDLRQILASKIASLPGGQHQPGLNAVKIHIDAAIRHRERGQQSDQTAFTDAIYRCNQAFEGSVKEAYRVLAEKNPEQKTPAQIEQFLISGNLLRPRVLEQLKQYRTEWRNKSTHDYMLDFDEDESLLAIVSVLAFSIVLCDQISGRLSFIEAQSTTKPNTSAVAIDDLRSAVERECLSFLKETDMSTFVKENSQKYPAFNGAIAGYLSAKFSKNEDIKVTQSIIEEGVFIDLVIIRGKERIAIETRITDNERILRNVAPITGESVHKIAKLPAITATIGLMGVSSQQADYTIFRNEQLDSRGISAVGPKALTNLYEEWA
ncbi:MAG: hypothetical protein JWR84_2727 [Caulobacter sp.]|nr:hypothetical protein [Caulobacter sp.]